MRHGPGTFLIIVALLSLGARPGAEGPLFREDWRVSPPALPVTQEEVTNPDLQLVLLGPGAAAIKKSHHDQPADDPYYVWSGEAEGTWAVALQYRPGAMDLTRGGRIVWRSRQTGYRDLHPIVQLADGSWLVADQSTRPSDAWREDRFEVADLTWRTLDPRTIVEGKPVSTPSLDRVRAVGCSDLMRGGGTPASSRLDWIEVYGARPGS